MKRGDPFTKKSYQLSRNFRRVCLYDYGDGLWMLIVELEITDLRLYLGDLHNFSRYHGPSLRTIQLELVSEGTVVKLSFYPRF